MRHLGVLMIVGLIALGSARGQSLENITSITLTKQSRGYLDEVIISRDSLQGFVENHRMPEASKQYATSVDEDRWAGLIMSLKDVPLEDIDGLQSPTTNRAHDGALHSSIVITLNDGQTISHSFDGENPHPDLQPLLDLIQEMRVPPPR